MEININKINGLIDTDGLSDNNERESYATRATIRPESSEIWDRATDSSYNSNYNINIEPLTTGYVLRVGCQSIAVESGDDVAKLIKIYLSGDNTIGDKWMKSDKIVKNFIKENLQVN